MTEIQPGIDPRDTALLVMDYQPAILHSIVDTEHLLSRVAEAIAVARRHGAQIGYVRVGLNDEDYAMVPPRSRMAPVVAAAGRALHSDSPATAIHAQLGPAPGDIIVRKTRVGAFSTTDLDRQLRDRGITTLILAGISTSGVVLSTVRDAHDRDYRVLVLTDATADAEPEVHQFLTEKIFPRQADVITVDELDGLFAAPGTQES
jgi:nicotinamidase-related amidase